MNAVIAGMIVALGSVSAYLATRVEDEMRALEKPLRITQALAGLSLLTVLPWYGALLIAGSLALGWLPMTAGIALLAALATTEPALALLTVALALLAGARWILDGRAPLPYAVATACGTLLFLGIRALGTF